jgi:hypothetical protein
MCVSLLCFLFVHTTRQPKHTDPTTHTHHTHARDCTRRNHARAATQRNACTHRTAQGVTLLSTIREVKNRGGFDTVGKVMGDACAQRVRHELVDTIGAKRTDEILARTKIIVGDANNQWWTSVRSHDSEEEIEKRVMDFLQLARFGPLQTPCFVGHSLFFKFMYSRKMSDALVAAKPQLADKMKKFKLDNATMMYLEFDFADEDNPEIVDAELMFGGGFHEH